MPRRDCWRFCAGTELRRGWWWNWAVGAAETKAAKELAGGARLVGAGECVGRPDAEYSAARDRLLSESGATLPAKRGDARAAAVSGARSDYGPPAVRVSGSEGQALRKIPAAARDRRRCGDQTVILTSIESSSIILASSA